jgi:hypothetical protein
MKIFILISAMMAVLVSGDSSTSARVLKGGGKGSKGSSQGGKGKTQQQCMQSQNPSVTSFPQCQEKSSPAKSVRFATFNASLNRRNEGDLKAELASPGSAQPDTIATIIQKVRPDVVLINEFDYDGAGEGLEGFMLNYLGVSHGGSTYNAMQF